MSLENRVRETAQRKIRVHVTRRRRGPFTITRPDGTQTEHRTRKEALTRLWLELRTLNSVTWSVEVLLRPEAVT